MFLKLFAAHYNTLVDNSEDSQSAVDSRELSLGQLLFARNHRKAVRNKGKTGPMYAQTVGPNNCEFKELLQLNSHLKKMGGNYKTASDVLAEWKYIGILKNEVAPNANIPYGTAPRSRTINLIVGHRVAILDYWIGYSLTASMPIYLVVKWDARGYWQIVPYADPNEPVPPMEELTVVMTNGDIKVGEAIRVGITSESRRMFENTRPSLDFTKSMARQGVLSTIEIYIGV